MVLFVVCNVFRIIVSTTGESAEHYLKDLNAIDEKYLKKHVATAGIANYGMIVVGALALVTLLFKRVRDISFMPYTITYCFCNSILNGKSCNLGTEIMHKEIRNYQIWIKL